MRYRATHRLMSAILLLAMAATAGATQPFTADDLVRLKRVSDPQVSPDGRHAVFVLRETDMEANRGRTDREA